MSHRVIRAFPYYTDRFLRVHFKDEYSKALPKEEITQDILQRIRRQLDQGRILNTYYFSLTQAINIGAYKFEYLAYSSSQLRDSSCWFFANAPDLSTVNLRKWLGTHCIL